MRLLTDAEIQQVSGGKSGPPIDVIGRRDYYLRENHSPAYSGSSDPRFQIYMQWAAGYYTAQAHDLAIDKVAKDVAKAIKTSKANLDNQEYSAILYQDSSGYHAGNILPGHNHDTGSHSIQDYGVPPGATIVGFVHNHPTYYDGINNSNRAFADNVDLAATANPFPGPTPVGKEEFRSYIMHDNILDEYDYASVLKNAASYQAPNVARPDIHPDASTTIQ
ncbi:hypothetical protein [Candidatus Burkholderia verschuerenii]|uniref:hypothetical protein n=1 Tax=Candidatus Burkholderia verschuerenii TaxID=242163 RepID=UPI000B335F24|nr:hypothetical protein [Candidatus Burkholderia verschuerenii]